MADPRPTEGRSRRSLPRRLWQWVDRRAGVEQLLRHSLAEPIPGGARFAYVFGSALLFIFLSQLVTGVCLALYYVPSPLSAHTSVAYIVKEVAGGSFLRSLHSYGSSAMVVVLLLHFLQTFFYGSYKGRRELLWISGCTLSLLVLGMTFTGYLLSWDQRAYSAGSVGTDIVGQVPFLGETLRLLLRGGTTMGALTLSRFYVLHILVVPGLIFAALAIHVVLFRKAGAAGPVTEDPVKPSSPTEMFYPKQVLIDMAFALFVMGALGMLAHFVPVTLGLQADPTNTRYLPRPEWYYLPMFQWLKYWEGWRTVIGVFVIPVILLGLFFSLPFMDRGLERRPWRRPIPVTGVLIVLIGMMWLGLTSRLEDSRNPIVADQLAQQKQEENLYSRSAFEPYSATPSSGDSSPTALGGTVAQGKGIFDSHGCNGCHGASGGGAVGPALTQISSQYSTAQLTALLKAPTAKMKAGGMVALTLDRAELSSLVSYLASLGGATSTPVAAQPTSGPSPPGPTPTGAPSPAGPSKGQTGGAPADATAASRGKGLFDSQRCSGCHGAAGAGAVGPALTDISSRFPPPRLTALLKAPTAKMKAAGMVPLTLNGADMKALVSYLTGLGGTATAPVAPPTGSASPAAQAGAEPTSAGPSATAAQSKAAAAATPAAAGSPTPAPTQAGTASPTGPPKAPTGGAPADATATSQGQGLFDSQRCSGCHGASGGGAVGPALTHISSRYPPAQLTALLKAPTAKMKAAGMVPLTLGGAEMKALVVYLTSLGQPSGASVESGPTSGSTPPAPAGGEPAVTGALSSVESRGKAVFEAHRCADCHGTNGFGGTAAAPALAGTGKTFAPAQLTTLLEHPTARMQHGGMPAVSLSKKDLKALAAYVSSISSSKVNPQ